MQVGGTIAAVGQRLIDGDREDDDQAVLRETGVLGCPRKYVITTAKSGW